MQAPDFPIHEQNGFRYIDRGNGPFPLVLLHGMLGDLGNWSHTVGVLAARGYRVLVPVLPVYDLPLAQTSVRGLSAYLAGFLCALDVQDAVLAGNSLGGHVALMYALAQPEAVRGLVLSGASGISEVEIGTGTPRRHDREFIRERAAFTFYDPAHATPALVEDLFELVNDRARVLRLIKMARAARMETIAGDLNRIQTPTLLVWGKDDRITPPDVGHAFRDRLARSELHFIERCGHAPMIERPETFNSIVLEWLDRTFAARSTGDVTKAA